MFWDNIAWIYDIFADGINRKANRKLCKVVAGLISPTDDVLECACGTGLLSGVIAKRCKSLTATDFSAKMLRAPGRSTGIIRMCGLSRRISCISPTPMRALMPSSPRT